MATSSDGDAGGGGGYAAALSTSADVNSAKFVSAQLLLVEARGMSPANAAQVLLTNECEECHCILNEPESPNLPETSQSGPESADESANIASQAPAQGQKLPTFVGAATADGKQEDGENLAATQSNEASLSLAARGDDNMMSDGEGDTAVDTKHEDARDDNEMEEGSSMDEGDKDSAADAMSDDGSADEGETESPEEDVIMTQVRLPDNATPSQLYAEIVNERAAHSTDNNPRYDRMVRLLFKRAYADAVPATLKKAKEDQLPTLADDELEELKELFAILLDGRKYSQPRLLGVLKEVSKASARSSWTLIKILRNRAATARIPDSAPANVWTKQPTNTPTVTASPVGQYEFDPTVYSAEEITVLTILCEQPHVFPETTRKPSQDEWKIIMGMINGSILAKALPQFLKRCATMGQVAWIHRQIMVRAEGELWTKLPALSKMYNFNQSSKRLISELRTNAAQYGFNDPRFDAMLGAVKVATYNHEMHSLHFHFFTKAVAAQWAGLTIPFRKSKLVLRNPDAEIAAATTVRGSSLPPSDNLVNDRYQANYKLRMTNISHTLDVSLLTRYLENLTEDGVKTGVPLDSYGPNSEWSLVWEVYAKRSACPPKLVNINRIMWGSHMIMVQHNPGQGRAPCLLCAQTGHQVAACTVAEADRFKTNTLFVTEAEIDQLRTPQKPWITAEDAFEVFTAMATPRAKQADLSSPQSTDANVKEPASGEQQAGQSENSSEMKGTAGAAETSGEPHDGHEGRQSSPGSEPAGHKGVKDTATDEKRAAGNLAAGANVADGKAVGVPKNAGWITKQSKSKAGKPQAPRKSSSDQTSGPRPAAGVGKESTNQFVNLASGDEADDDDDDEAVATSEDKNDIPQPSSSQRTPSSTNQPTDSEAEALDRAVAWARLEKARSTMYDHLTLHQRRFDATEPLAAIGRALPNVAKKSSRAWILESVGGRLTETPKTGNCQPLALTEALHQEEIRGSTNRAAMVQTTMLGKFGMLRAAEHEILESTFPTNLAAILDNPTGTRTDETPAEQKERVRKFYTDLALSGSDLTDTLPKELWGGYDSLRRMAKLIDRRIYLISDYGDGTDVHLHLMQPQPSRKGHPTCAMHQPGTTAWLEAIAADLADANEAPIILSYAGEHYIAVLLDRHIAPADRLTTAKLRDTRIPELWTSVSTSLDDMIDTAAKQARTSQAVGPTHADVIRADARVTEDDLYEFLAQANWSTAEKKELIAILVGDQLNYKELLTAVVTPGIEESQQSGRVSARTASERSEDSEWSEEESSGVDSRASSQAYSLSQPAAGEYCEWADAMWESVTAVWEEQYNQPIPSLTESVKLEKLARDEPTTMCELGRWCENPFVLLDHLSQPGIRDWMERKRQDYVIRELTAVADCVVDSEVKRVLLDWLEAVATLDTKLARVRLREQGMWDLLKQAAPQAFNKTTAPFLTRDYATTCAYVLVLDELYPDLAGHALRNNGFMDTEGSTLIDAYCRVPELRQVLKTAQGPADKGGKSWEPIER